MPDSYDSLSSKLKAECRIAGYRDAVIHTGVQATSRVIRIPGLTQADASALDAFVRGPLANAGFEVDFHAYDCRFGGDEFKGGMIYGKFQDRRQSTMPIAHERRSPSTSF